MSGPPVIHVAPKKDYPNNLPADNQLDNFDPENFIPVDRSIKNNESVFLMIEPGFNLYPTGLHVGLGARFNLKYVYLDFLGQLDSNFVIAGKGDAAFGDPFLGVGGKFRALFPLGRFWGVEHQLGPSIAYQGNIPFADYTGIHSSLIYGLAYGLGGVNSSALLDLGVVQDLSHEVYSTDWSFVARLGYNFSFF